ncbi:MAG: NUDIX hydrolase [Acidobacteriia bacterium]|nr:NUDIX hydrolase [Terriglobia bacterium]
MDRSSLLRELETYQAATPQEETMRLQLIRFVTTHEQCFSRNLQLGHITASAWVLDLDGNHVLLTHHRKLNRWLQLGGHTEGEARLVDSALRETREESGLLEVKAVREEIFDLDIHTIPARGPEPEHLHYDVRFLLQASRQAPLLVSSESKNLAWVKLDEVQRLNPAESMMRMVRKARERPSGPSGTPK